MKSPKPDWRCEEAGLFTSYKEVGFLESHIKSLCWAALKFCTFQLTPWSLGYNTPANCITFTAGVKEIKTDYMYEYIDKWKQWTDQIEERDIQRRCILEFIIFKFDIVIFRYF